MPARSIPRYPVEEYLDADKIFLQRLEPHDDILHGHDFFELVYVMSGSALHQLGVEISPVVEGDYFIVDFGSFHRYLETRDFTIVNCLFAPEYVDRVLVNSPSLSALLSNELRQFTPPALHSRPADLIYHDADGHIRGLIEAMEKEYAARDTGYLEIIRCHLIEILVHATRQASARSATQQPHPAVAAMAEYLHEHCFEPLSLNALSDFLAYTPQYLSSLFHKQTGVSMSTYLQRLRVQKSCRMLAETQLSISQIAHQVGYCDLKHFHTVFRRYTNVSPREFRALNGKAAAQPARRMTR